jgi:hypothetical protein
MDVDKFVGEMSEPERNTCRRVRGTFEDGLDRYVWTVADGSGLLHDHGTDNACPLTAARADQLHREIHDEFYCAECETKS